MARTKSVPDEAVLDRLLAVVVEAGPTGLTFARAAKAAGLSAATLVQRYGSSQSMLEAVLLRAWDQLDAATRTADENAALTPQGAVDLLMALTPSGTAEYNATDGLLLLREDIRNPVLRARGAAWGLYLADALGRRLSDDAGKAERLGWQMASVWQGANIWWAFTRSEPSEIATRRALLEWLENNPTGVKR
ncbi:TetR/AcrR family transcriptional regulator [Ochrobactrum vermis]|uniref:TetR/AcrR family transcriptional regulator n=1 Tax=Ochrobactrum vermis TaxID=1827297 RepID=A0ABU8PDV5_9HYPH|nr:TetR family transcriptional regulator [Ochrobactrum vermis]PQZ30764.1 TetR family transcriptional regulator [Ochrobactrum vermis]